MTEQISERTRNIFRNSVGHWANKVHLASREGMNFILTPEETDALLLDYFKEEFPHYLALKDKLPMPGVHQQALTLHMNDGISVWNVTWTFAIHGAYPLPLLYRQNNWNVQYLPTFQEWKTAFPPRLIEYLEQIHQFHAALVDVKECLNTYTRARYMLSQWPNSIRFMPDYVRREMKSRQYVRAVPKDVRQLKPETLSTLALMSLIEPFPENP